jgi:hypothetical protein
MNESTSRHRAPLIPTISTIDQDEPVASVGPASEESQTICVVVIAVVEVNAGSLETATVRPAISSPTTPSPPEDRAP